MRQLALALSDGGALRRLGLLDMEEGGLFAPILPGPGVTARLLGWPVVRSTPPGTTRVLLEADWKDLVLPPDRVDMLREFLHWITHRETVIERWGARPAGGPIALFTGPPGTGKTLAASVIASQLGWPLYRVDLGSLVSKYIGETEKNLNRLFAATHRQPAVLQFDEADSLFGKRGEVREARDRYANLEVSHLLARIEQHEGPCILTTNLRGQLDAAFARRFQVVVEFPRPNAEARARLWRLHLPPRAPVDAFVDLDLIGGAVHLTGGGIRNAALHAAFLAAAGRGTIGLPEIALAVWRELARTDGRSRGRSRRAGRVRGRGGACVDDRRARPGAAGGLRSARRNIARLLGDELSRLSFDRPASVKRLDLGHIAIPPRAADIHVATAIAGAIGRALGSSARAAAPRKGER